MSPIATALIAWFGVYVYASLYYGGIYLLRRGQREYLLFAGLCACLGLISIATAFALDATTVAQAALAQVPRYVGGLLACALFVDFVLRLVDVPRPRLLRAIYASAIVGTAAAVAGLFVDPAFPDPSYDWSTHAESPPAAELSVIGMLFLSLSLLTAAFGAARLLSSAGSRRELRIALIASALAIGLGSYDLFARIFDLTPHHMGAHATLLVLVGFSYVLVGRFTHVDAQLENRREELARSYDHLRVAQEELVKKEQLAAVGELSAVIAHEVRNPLAIIKNAVSGLRRAELPADDAETLLSILDEETDRLNRLVNDLLAYAKPISPEARPVDMRNLVGHAVELAAGGNRDISEIEIELDLDREIDPVEGDEALLRHALINIVDNALQAMPHGGTLTITCRNTVVEDRPSVAVDFHDTGEGMDTLVRSKARDPFFTTRQTGTGLGLAIVDRVARAHGGRVEIESRHGKGTKVSFIVPRNRSSIAPPSS